MTQELPRESGFSLVELMVCVSIIGILSAVAVPKFQNFMGKAKQSEAKTNLAMISTLQESYNGDNDQYWDGWGIWATALAPLGFAADGNARYLYSTCARAGCGGYTIGSYNAKPIVSGCPLVQDQWWMSDTIPIFSPAGNDCTKL